MKHRVVRAAAISLLGLSAGYPAEAETLAQDSACRPLTCSTLLPAPTPEDPATNDCGYRNGNAWWLDHVAAPLAWAQTGPREPVTVAVFDDGADIGHIELRNQLWTNTAEANGAPGVDDDGNGVCR